MAGGVGLLARARIVRRFAVAVSVVIFVSAALAARSGVEPGEHRVAQGVVLRRSGSEVTAVLSGGIRPDDALAGLRHAGARCVDTVLLAGGPAAEVTAAALARRCPGTVVVDAP